MPGLEEDETASSALVQPYVSSNCFILSDPLGKNEVNCPAQVLQKSSFYV